MILAQNIKKRFLFVQKPQNLIKKDRKGAAKNKCFLPDGNPFCDKKKL